MVVEDDPYIRNDLAEILRHEGYEVITARDGGEALTWMRSATQPAVILLDLMMSGMNGWEFRDHQLRDPRLAAVPVIILSGVTEVPKHAAQLDVADYFSKPVKLDRLLETVQRRCPARAESP